MMNNEVKISFIDTSQETIKMMIKLSKNALKKSGKVVTTVLKDQIPVRTGGLKKSITAWAKIDYKTGQPHLEVGYLSRKQMIKKYGIKYFVNPWWFEFGTRPHSIMTKEYKKYGKSSYELNDSKQKYGILVQHPGMSSKNFLRNTVYNNIDKIREAQEEDLAKLTDLMITAGMNVGLNEEDEEID